MAKSKVQVEEDDELEELDDLEDLADEVDLDDEEVEEEDEAPRKKKKAGKVKAEKKTKAKPKEDDTIGSSDLAEALGTTGRELRVLLRSKGVKKNENNRYEWESVEDALEQLGYDDVEEAQTALEKARAKRIEALKEKAAESRKAKKKSAKAEVEDEDDDLEEEDEDEEPTPKAKKKSKK